MQETLDSFPVSSTLVIWFLILPFPNPLSIFSQTWQQPTGKYFSRKEIFIGGAEGRQCRIEGKVGVKKERPSVKTESQKERRLRSRFHRGSFLCVSSLNRVPRWDVRVRFPLWTVASQGDPPSEMRCEMTDPWLILQLHLSPHPASLAWVPANSLPPSTPQLQVGGPPSSASPRLAGRTHQWGALGGGPRTPTAWGRPANFKLAAACFPRGGGAAGKAPTWWLWPGSVPHLPN